MGVIFAIYPFWSLSPLYAKTPYELAESATNAIKNVKSFKCETTTEPYFTRSDQGQSETPTQNKSTVLYKKVNNLITYMEIINEISNNIHQNSKRYFDGNRIIDEYEENGRVIVSQASLSKSQLSTFPEFFPPTFSKQFLLDQKMTYEKGYKLIVLTFDGYKEQEFYNNKNKIVNRQDIIEGDYKITVKIDRNNNIVEYVNDVEIFVKPGNKKADIVNTYEYSKINENINFAIPKIS